MNLEALPKYYSPKSPKLSDDAPATGTGCLTITDVMAAQGMVQSKAPLGLALFLAKVGVQDPQFAIEGLLNYAMALDNPTLNKLSEEIRLQIIPYLVSFAFADYSRSAASKARCEHCSGTGFYNVFSIAMVRAKPAQRAEGVRVKGLFWMKKEPGFMAYRYIRFVGVVMETGLVVYRPRWHDVMSRSWYQT